MLSNQFIIHYGLHFIAPLGIAYLYDSKNWKRNFIILLATMLIDLDHLLAYPNVFNAQRCSINYHPLHTYYAVAIYAILLLFKKTRLIAIGLLFHILTDYIDCLLFM